MDADPSLITNPVIGSHARVCVFFQEGIEGKIEETLPTLIAHKVFVYKISSNKSSQNAGKSVRRKPKNPRIPGALMQANLAPRFYIFIVLLNSSSNAGSRHKHENGQLSKQQ
jgi:hypothetical protein